MQQQYGISLKDACHRLYLTETSKLEAIDTAEKTMAVIRSQLDKASNDETLVPIEHIDLGSLDDHIFPHIERPEEDLLKRKTMTE